MTGQWRGLAGMENYGLCIEFDRHVRELAEVLVAALRDRLDPDRAAVDGIAGNDGTFHMDELDDWIRAVSPRAHVLPDLLSPGGEDMLDTYVVRYAVARGWIEPDPNYSDEHAYRLVIRP